MPIYSGSVVTVRNLKTSPFYVAAILFVSSMASLHAAVLWIVDRPHIPGLWFDSDTLSCSWCPPPTSLAVD